jgi:hypothetical protein
MKGLVQLKIFILYSLLLLFTIFILLKLYFYGKKFRSKVQGKENLKIQKTLINIFILWKEFRLKVKGKQTSKS